MKQAILCAMLLAITASSFSQQTNPSEPFTKADYLQKSKNLKTDGWVLIDKSPVPAASNSYVSAEETKVSKTRLIIGVSVPELLHAGVTYRIANASQLGLSAGAGPSLEMIWTSLNLEHRLYLGKNSQKTNQKTWFCRQGTTFFPSAKSSQQFTLNLSVGKDLIFKNNKSGITIDAGVFYLPESESSSIILVRSLNLWPALRFEFYFSL